MPRRMDRDVSMACFPLHLPHLATESRFVREWLQVWLCITPQVSRSSAVMAVH